MGEETFSGSIKRRIAMALDAEGPRDEAPSARPRRPDRRAQQPKESRIQASIVAYLRRVYPVDLWLTVTTGGKFGKAGVPDVLCCFRGVFVAIEVKRPGAGVLSDLQRRAIEQINAAGGVSFVATSVDDVRRMFNDLSSRRPTAVSKEV